MDFSYLKFIFYINKKDKILWTDLCDKFGITKSEAREILYVLRKNEYVVAIGDCEYKSTYRSKHIIKSFILSFININFIDILALLVSISALIVSIIALASQ